MSLYRTEFNRTIVRLKLIKDELLEKGFEETAQDLSQVLTLLNQTDSCYIQELAKHQSNSAGKIKSQPF
ncbi:MAG TPA: hypothetical protein DDW50_00730 [Firmicutes bacterium]|nr:hypothetical protein [Bacillota bacterium]